MYSCITKVMFELLVFVHYTIEIIYIVFITVYIWYFGAIYPIVVEIFYSQPQMSNSRWCSKSQGITKVVGDHPLGTLMCHVKLQGIPSNCRLDVLVWTNFEIPTVKLPA